MKDERRMSMEFYSLNELGDHVKNDDLLLEGTITVKVDVSLERLHQRTKDETGAVKLTLGEGYLVSLGLPSCRSSEHDVSLFSDGEPQMICDLKYLGEESSSVAFEDAVKALGIDPHAKIWNVKKAP
jgi:hypothetical protein